MAEIANDNTSLKDHLDAARAKDRATRKIIYAPIFAAALVLSTLGGASAEDAKPLSTAVMFRAWS